MNTRLSVVKDTLDHNVIPAESAPDGCVPVGRVIAARVASMVVWAALGLFAFILVRDYELPQWGLILTGYALCSALDEACALLDLLLALRRARAKTRAEEVRGG